MSLIGNYSALNKNAGRLRTGTNTAGASASFTMGNYHMHGFASLSWQDKSSASLPLIGMPMGYGGVGWQMPILRGALSSYRNATISLTPGGTVRKGYVISGNVLFTINASGTGEYITWSPMIGSALLTVNANGDVEYITWAGVVGNALVTISASAAIAALGLAAGSGSIIINANGTMQMAVGVDGPALITIGALMNTGAIGWLIGNGGVSFDGAADPLGTGWMIGTTAEAGLTNTGIANSVWNALAAQLNVPGSMGEKMNAAGNAGDPWLTELPGPYAEGTAGDIIGNQVPDIKTLTEFLSHIEGGQWEIKNNQMIFYKSDNHTEVARFDLYNATGVPSMTEVYERRRV